MSEQKKYFCDRNGCGIEITEEDCKNTFVGSNSLKIHRKKGFHLCNEHVEEFKKTYNLK